MLTVTQQVMELGFELSLLSSTQLQSHCSGLCPVLPVFGLSEYQPQKELPNSP